LTGGAIGTNSMIATGASTMGAGLGSMLAAIPGWGWALAGVLGAGALLSKESTPTSNSGFLLHDVPGASADRKFAVDPFASGFTPVGFNRRGDMEASREVIDFFRTADAALTEIFRGAGYDVNMSASNFRHLGTSETGMGDGVFIGKTAEGGNVIDNIQRQLNGYVDAFIQSIPGLGQDVIDKILGGDGAAETIMLAQDHFRELEEATKAAAESVDTLVESTYRWGQMAGRTAEDRTYSQYSPDDTPAEAIAKELRNRAVWRNEDQWNRIYGNASAEAVASLRRVDGSHANGLDFVPYDGYIAELHKGEKVVPASKAQSEGAGMQALLAKVDNMQIALNALIVNTGSVARNVDAVTKAGGGRKFATVEVPA
jgi:hypothetical protein